jgi:hypothetical protein
VTRGHIKTLVVFMEIAIPKEYVAHGHELKLVSIIGTEIGLARTIKNVKIRII